MEATRRGPTLNFISVGLSQEALFLFPPLPTLLGVPQAVNRSTKLIISLRAEEPSITLQLQLALTVAPAPACVVPKGHVASVQRRGTCHCSKEAEGHVAAAEVPRGLKSKETL